MSARSLALLRRDEEAQMGITRRMMALVAGIVLAPLLAMSVRNVATAQSPVVRQITNQRFVYGCDNPYRPADDIFSGKLGAGPCDPAISADGTVITFDDSRNTFLAGAGGEFVRQLTTIAPNDPDSRCWHARASAGGRRVVMLCGPYIEGSGWQILLLERGRFTTIGEGWAPRISEDGRVVVFNSQWNETGENIDGSMEVFLWIDGELRQVPNFRSFGRGNEARDISHDARRLDLGEEFYDVPSDSFFLKNRNIPFLGASYSIGEKMTGGGELARAIQWYRSPEGPGIGEVFLIPQPCPEPTICAVQLTSRRRLAAESATITNNPYLGEFAVNATASHVALIGRYDDDGYKSPSAGAAVEIWTPAGLFEVALARRDPYKKSTWYDLSFDAAGRRLLLVDSDGVVPQLFVIEPPTTALQTPTPTATATPTPPTPITCVGDCGDDGAVTVDEIIRGVNIALGTASVGSCGAFDVNGDNAVTVDEIVKAVNAALNGCSA